MKIRFLTLATVFALLLSLCPTALAAQSGEVRDTDFFTDQEHADVNFADMTYVHMAMSDIQPEIDAIRELISSGNADTGEVHRRFDLVTDFMQKLRTMSALLRIRKAQDVSDTWAAEEYIYVQKLQIEAYDAYCFLMKDILQSSNSSFLLFTLSSEVLTFLFSFEGTSQEETERALRETQLVDSYYAAIAASGTYPVEVSDGVTVTLQEATDDMTAAQDKYMTDPTDETYQAYLEAYAIYVLAYEGDLQALNTACGNIYLKLVALRNEIAREAGYANYMDYAYENVYFRDYTPADIRAFEGAVKENIPEINVSLTALVAADGTNPVYSADYVGDAGDTAFEMMRPYVGRISSEVREAFNYMMDHHLYDYGNGSGNKDGNGFTTILPSYGAPFTFNTPNGTLYDFSTAVHEFGHYNRYYWTPQGIFDYTDNIDQAEVHSQGMELMFTQFYDEIFGKNSDTALNYLMTNLTGALMDGCLQDEFQQYAYRSANLTLDMLNTEYNRLCVEYGRATEDNDGGGYYTYGWVYIPHTFERPGYYISYATSVSGAFSFWLDAQKDGYEDAMDAYLTYASLPADLGFRESLAKAGVEDPLTAGYVADLAEALWTALDVENQMYTIVMDQLFSDVDHTQWFADAVWSMQLLGLMQGVGDGMYAPYDTSSRAMAVTVLWRLMEQPAGGDGRFTDVADNAWYTDAVNWAASVGVVNGVDDSRFAPNNNVTREQFAVMLYHLAVYDGLAESASADLSAYTDAASVSAWATDAMTWAVGSGILTGTDGKLLAPGSDISRAEMAVMILRFINLMAA